MTTPVLETNLAGLPLIRGKVRDMYDLGESMLMVSTDRISAFDWILPTPIPDKGRVLTAVSLFWFELLGVGDQILETDVAKIDLPAGADREALAGRTILVKKASVAQVECVVRGYLAGSGWKDYQRTGAVCGIGLPAGLAQSEQLPEPVFTPATKAAEGHDENIPFERMQELIGADAAEELRRRSIDLYQRGVEHAKKRGIIIADTKFEWGQLDGRWILVDECLTPDSSRFWPADEYRTGISPPSFDKQFVRDYLESTDWDKNSPPPELPAEIVSRTRAKYVEAYERLSGREFEWK